MKLFVRLFQGLCVAGLFACGIVNAEKPSVAEVQYWENVSLQGSHWYCVSEAPGGMQSAGHIGYGHGQTRKESARRAVEACGRDGGFQCAEAQCFPE